jgi:hypothetical protein
LLGAVSLQGPVKLVCFDLETTCRELVLLAGPVRITYSGQLCDQMGTARVLSESSHAVHTELLETTFFGLVLVSKLLLVVLFALLAAVSLQGLVKLVCFDLETTCCEFVCLFVCCIGRRPMQSGLPIQGQGSCCAR